MPKVETTTTMTTTKTTTTKTTTTTAAATTAATKMLWKKMKKKKLRNRFVAIKISFVWKLKTKIGSYVPSFVRSLELKRNFKMEKIFLVFVFLLQTFFVKSFPQGGGKCTSTADCVAPNVCSKWGWCQWTKIYGEDGPRWVRHSRTAREQELLASIC